MVKDNHYLDLVAEARSGNRDSMSQLAGHIHDRLYSYLHRVTSDRDLAQDLLQEILLTMVRFVNKLEEPASFWPWIYRVARSKIHQHFRGRRRRESVEAAVADGAYHRRDAPGNPDVLDIIVHQERLRNLSVAIDQLDQPYREVVQLRCFEGMPYSEIASTIDCSPQQARVRFLRAKHSLRGTLVVASLTEDRSYPSGSKKSEKDETVT